MKKNILKSTLLVGFGCLTFGLTAQNVTSGLDDGSAGTLRTEIQNAAPGSTVTIQILVTNIALDSAITINKAITVTAMNAVTPPVVDAQTNGRVFTIVSGPVTLSNVELINGVAADGGAIKITNANVTATNLNIHNNIANGASGSGGGILIGTGGFLTITGSDISNNQANRAGGGIEINSGAANALAMNNCTMDANNAGVAPATAAPGNGGAIHITGASNAVIVGGSATNNTAALEGGAHWNGTGTLDIDGSLIDNNSAAGAASNEGGGGLFNAGGTMIINNATISNNSATGTAGSGGGILNDFGNLFVMNSEISTNTAIRAGGGIESVMDATDSLSLLNVDLLTNSVGIAPGNGGGLHITGPGNSQISGGTVVGNTASSEGGGLWNGTGIMTIDSTSFDGNTASGDGADQGGGALFNAGGTLVVLNATMNNNVADGAAGSGGAILNDLGTLTVSDCSFDGNSAVRAGGAIEENSTASSLLIVSNSFLTNNSASSAPGNGGAVHVTGAGNSNFTSDTLSGNTADLEGGGLWNGAGTMTVDACQFLTNSASGPLATEGGGALFNAGGTLIVTDSEFDGNVANGAAGSGGAILNDLGTLAVTSSIFTNNSSIRAGGAIEDNSMAGTTTLINETTFDGNSTGSAPGNGGAFHITGPGNTMIYGGSATNNTAASEGGAFWNSTGTMTIDSTLIDGNIASGDASDNGGGGVFNNGGTMKLLSDTKITNNVADGAAGSGGGFFSTAGNVTISGVTFDGNSANRAGGAIEIVDGILMMSKSILTNNDLTVATATPNPGSGGALHVTGNSTNVSISECIVKNNAATATGGGLWNQSGSIMNVELTTIDGNSANGGGGVHNNGGIINIKTSTISNNNALAADGGGGVLNLTGGNVSMTRSTVSGNSSTGNGGGILNKDIMSLSAVTIAENTSTVNGGGVSGETAVSINNTLIANNTAAAGNDVDGIITSGGYNIVASDDANVFTPGTGDIEGSSLTLGPLADNGGVTFTHSIALGSIAINNGDPTVTFKDQRDTSIVGIRDIGAYEFTGNVGLNELTSDLIASVYPNPSNGTFTVALTDNIGDQASIQIISLTGQLIQSVPVDSGLNTVQLPSDVANGLYIVRVSNTNNFATFRIQILN